MVSAPTPITILTGFLGSGKTTLINRLIEARGSRRLAVIENEYGEVGVDAALLTHLPEQVIIQIADGCVCCTVRGDLANALNELVRRRDRDEIEFDHVILETTGLADPGPIVRTFLAKTAVLDHFYLNGVMALAEARCGVSIIADRPEAAAQIAYANRAFITKTDLAGEGGIAALEAALTQINPLLETRPVDLRHVEADALAPYFFDMNGYLFDYVKPGAGAHSHEHDHDHGAHLSDVVSVAWQAEGELDAARIEMVLGALRARYPDALWRIKGILAVAGARRKLIVQGVQGLVEVNPSTLWRPHERKRSTLVLIGRKLDRDAIGKALEACVVPARAAAR